MMRSVEGNPIPLLDENLNIICTVPFIDNLTISHVPEYVNQNGYMGLVRLYGLGCVHDGELVIMYYDKNYPERSYAEFITEEEACRECMKRGKNDVAKKLGLNIDMMEREVI